MSLKYFFYHQIFFQDSAQTEKLTVHKLKNLQCSQTLSTEHEHFEILSMNILKY